MEVSNMSKFRFSKSREANCIKSIRFPEDLNNRINELVQEYNKRKKEQRI